MAGPPREPRPVLTLNDLVGRAVISVEELSAVLGMRRSATYDAIKRGDLPSFKVGRRVLIPVPRLLALLGAEPDADGGAS